MKCGTSALCRYLDLHPDIAMAPAKEVNFFFGGRDTADSSPATWRTGQWSRGTRWYAANFDATAPVRGEASPGYTSPDHPHVARRMAATIPEARLVYLVRDPADRAVSHYEHHAREGAERRPLEEAVLDPDSQYLARSRYFERLAPFLEVFPSEQILVVVSERLLHDRRRQLERVFAHVGADPGWWDDGLQQRVNVGGAQAPAGLRRAVTDEVADDTARLARYLDDDLPEWPR
jgi:hypothetical protein